VRGFASYDKPFTILAGSANAGNV